MFFGPACDDISDLFNVWKTLLADAAMKENITYAHKEALNYCMKFAEKKTPLLI